MLYLGIQFIKVIARTNFIRSNAQLIRNYKEFYIEIVIYLYLFTNRGLHTIRLSGQFFSCLDSFAVAVAKISPWLSRAERASPTCETDITGTVFRKARAARKISSDLRVFESGNSSVVLILTSVSWFIRSSRVHSRACLYANIWPTTRGSSSFKRMLFFLIETL